MNYIFSFLMVLVLLPSSAWAANFCLAGPGLEPQCMYDDIQTCKKAANPPNTDCFANDQANLNQFGNAAYCLVTSQLTAECLYFDRDQCNDEARRKNAVCKENLNAANQSENPYRYDTRVQR